MAEIRSITNPVINKISKAEYDAKVAAGVITETMIADQIWINQNMTIADQENLRNLKAVATSGSYNDLADKPTIPTKTSDITNDSGFITANDIPEVETPTCSTIGAVSTSEKGVANGVATLGADSKLTASQMPSVSYNNLTDKPTLFSGSYNDLTNKPELFSGSYNDLTDKPTIPSVAGLASETYVNQKVADLVNSAPTTLDTLGEVATAIQNNANVVEGLNSAIGNKANASDVTALTTRVGTAETNITALQSGKADKSELFSGSYNDLTDKPTLSTCTLKIWG